MDRLVRMNTMGSLVSCGHQKHSLSVISCLHVSSIVHIIS